MSAPRWKEICTKIHCHNICLRKGNWSSPAHSTVSTRFLIISLFTAFSSLARTEDYAYIVKPITIYPQYASRFHFYMLVLELCDQGVCPSYFILFFVLFVGSGCFYQAPYFSPRRYSQNSNVSYMFVSFYIYSFISIQCLVWKFYTSTM